MTQFIKTSGTSVTYRDISQHPKPHISSKIAKEICHNSHTHLLIFFLSLPSIPLMQFLIGVNWALEKCAINHQGLNSSSPYSWFFGGKLLLHAKFHRSSIQPLEKEKLSFTFTCSPQNASGNYCHSECIFIILMLIPMIPFVYLLASTVL